MTARVATYDTALGTGWLRFAGDALVQAGLPGTASPPGQHVRRGPAAELAGCLEEYWAGRGPLPRIDSIAATATTTPLQARIYTALLEVAAGATVSYSDLAGRAGRPGAARAVGAAMARNPVAPLIPCHRVVGSDGSLRGYAGGVEMKRYLLALESKRG